MKLSTLSVLTLSRLFSLSTAAYTIKDDYSPTNFFSMFDFFTDADPTDGYVDYISQSAAQSASLISTANNQVYMGVDSTSVASGRGRQSVRLTSKAVYNHALIVLDLEHMPGSICGVWPAFWTVGPNWPTSGEIDIIEGVNTQMQNAMTLHTGPGCTVGGTTGGLGGTVSNAAASFSGSLATSNCDINAAGQAANAGCSISDSAQSSYGSGLNSVQGGVYATEWLSTGISIWYFPRSQIPSDIASGSPNPSNWGTPTAFFGGSGCDIDDSIKNQQIVFDTTFCGQWAGAVWSSDATCSQKASTCQAYVQNNPSAFQQAYWTINSLKVYTSDGSSASPSSAGATSKASSIAAGTASKSAVSIGSSMPVPVPFSSSTKAIPGKPSGPATSAAVNTPVILSTPAFVSTSAQGRPTTTAAPFVGQTTSRGGQQQNTWSRGSGHRSSVAEAANVVVSGTLISESSATNTASGSSAHQSSPAILATAMLGAQDISNATTSTQAVALSIAIGTSTSAATTTTTTVTSSNVLFAPNTINQSIQPITTTTVSNTQTTNPSLLQSTIPSSSSSIPTTTFITYTSHQTLTTIATSTTATTQNAILTTTKSPSPSTQTSNAEPNSNSNSDSDSDQPWNTFDNDSNNNVAWSEWPSRRNVNNNGRRTLISPSVASVPALDTRFVPVDADAASRADGEREGQRESEKELEHVREHMRLHMHVKRHQKGERRW